jgi:hypothetical protein
MGLRSPLASPPPRPIRTHRESAGLRRAWRGILAVLHVVVARALDLISDSTLTQRPCLQRIFATLSIPVALSDWARCAIAARRFPRWRLWSILLAI